MQPPPIPPPTVILSVRSEVFTSSQSATNIFLTSPAKVSYLEGAISFIKKLNSNEYPFQENQCVFKKLKRDLVNNKKYATSWTLLSDI